MGSKERRDRERQDLRERILEAAREIIQTEGFAALSMRKLADRIEYSPGSIYLYFRSREEIAQHLGEAGFSDLLRALTKANTGKDLRERFSRVAFAYVTFGLEHAEFYRMVLMGDSEYMHAAFGRASDGTKAEGAREFTAADRSFALLTELAADMRAAGHRGDAEPPQVAEMIWAALHGIVSLRIACSDFALSPTDELISMMTDTVWRGLMETSPARAAEKAPAGRKAKARR